MAMDGTQLHFEVAEAGVLANAPDSSKWLHPLWLRERGQGPHVVDPVNGQRLYDPSMLDPSLSVVEVRNQSVDELIVSFSDGVECSLSIAAIAIELGFTNDPQSPPVPENWIGSLSPRPEADWNALDDPDHLRRALDGFFRYGFCVFRNTPTAPGSLRTLAERFGYVRETNFGMLFDVVKKPHANDLAYTNSALAAHTDNPYRKPIPGIQFLHCLENSVSGGLSTLVDGFAIVEQLIQEAPDQAAVLERTPVRFRYEAAGGAISQNYGTLIERNQSGALKRVRLSSRLDFAPPLARDEMGLYYAGRRRLQQLANDREFEIRYTFEPGMLLMMDNYRTLHGRTQYDDGAGHRHLQGCYIDHDGPDGLYRMLVRDGAAKVGRDVA